VFVGSGDKEYFFGGQGGVVIVAIDSLVAGDGVGGGGFVCVSYVCGAVGVVDGGGYVEWFVIGGGSGSRW